MVKYASPTARLLTLIAVSGVLLVGCTAKDGAGIEDAIFEVNPERLGPVYVNQEAGVSCQPPVGWEQLQGDQKQAVLDALTQPEAEDSYSLDVSDIFFSTESLSFLAFSTVTLPGGTADLATYVQTNADLLGIEEGDNDENALAARMDFSVNGIQMVHFRSLYEEPQSGRVTVSLIFPGADDQVIRLDYSIPTEHYQREVMKLESSIGTIERL